MENQLRGTIVFNAQDKPNRPEIEKIKSVKFTPSNTTGQFLTLGPNDPFEERRAAINAILRFVFAMDHVNGPLHKYDAANPSRVGGSIGWFNVNGIPVPSDGTIPINVTWRWEGRITTVTLPHRQVKVTGEEIVALSKGEIINLNDRPEKGENVSVVFLNSDWLTVKQFGTRIELSNPPIDKKTGKNLGGLLHDYIDQLHKGVQITVATTVTNWTDPLTGEKVLLDSMQTKAAWLERVLNVEGFDWNKTRQDLIDSNILWRNGKAFEGKLEYQDTDAPSDDEIHQQAQDTLNGRANGTQTGMTVMFKVGKKYQPTDTALVPAGVYNIYNLENGKEGACDSAGVPISRHGGAVTLNRLTRRPDLGLSLVKKYESRS